jgi:hypothetical protein
MRIIALEVGIAGAPGDGFARHAREEAACLWGLVQAGVVRETWFRSDRTEAVLVLECQDQAEAHSHLATLPYVANGLIRFELIGLRAYPGFARLFGEPPAQDGSTGGG